MTVASFANLLAANPTSRCGGVLGEEEGENSSACPESILPPPPSPCPRTMVIPASRRRVRLSRPHPSFQYSNWEEASLPPPCVKQSLLYSFFLALSISRDWL
ncbi:hypothetical protein CDAR_567751 [Caerostris darwini]|uniref:Uncharacterized protein n=1 Tax=Caerostris darwini TaxID=1538125 RepID=A0AAV4RP81_9ARAC|nr:hypothetical protein CDAR_567751 [Caerostris darwini]